MWRVQAARRADGSVFCCGWHGIKSAPIRLRHLPPLRGGREVIAAPTVAGSPQMRAVAFASPATRGNIGRTADVCSGCCPQGEPQGCGEYKLPEGLMGALFALLGTESRAPPSACGTFPRCAEEGKSSLHQGLSSLLSARCCIRFPRCAGEGRSAAGGCMTEATTALTRTTPGSGVMRRLRNRFVILPAIK